MNFRKMCFHIGIIVLIAVLMFGTAGCGNGESDVKNQDEQKDTFTYTSKAGYSVELPNIYKDKVSIEEYQYEDNIGDMFNLKSQNDIDDRGTLFAIYKRSSDDASTVIEFFGEDSILGTSEDGTFFYGVTEPTDVQFDEEHQEEYEEMKKYKESIIESFSADDFVRGALPNYDPSENDALNGLTFEEKQLACIAYNNMNWANFYQYPEDYNDGQYYYLVGEVVNANSDGSGLLRLVENDDRTIVQYYSDGSIRLYEGTLVAIYGKISAGGSYTYADTGATYSCPLVYIEECQGSEMEITSLADYEKEFVYNTYVNIDGYFASFPGESFEFTEESFAGYPYRIKSIEYTCGTVLASSYDVHSNRMRISFSIIVDKEGEEVPILLSFFLDGNVRCNRMDGSGYDEYVR